MVRQVAGWLSARYGEMHGECYAALREMLAAVFAFAMSGEAQSRREGSRQEGGSGRTAERCTREAARQRCSSRHCYAL